MVSERYGDIAVRLEGNVALAEIQRPPNNFFDHQLILDLARAFEDLDRERDCRAIVLASQGKAFCAGANFQNRSILDVSETRGRNPLYDEAVRLFSNSKPVVAAVQGPAIGGGLGLAVMADFRVACPEARFAANFVKLGIHPGFGLTLTLPRLIGQQKAALMFLTGRRIDGEEAARWGLADLLVPQQTVREEALKLAAEIAEGAPLAVQSTRLTLRRHLAAEVREQTDREGAEQSWLSRTEDHKEGIRAVAERRPGKFSAR
jgi:enoyl-CoA hydratase/carnithine racemase